MALSSSAAAPAGRLSGGGDEVSAVIWSRMEGREGAAATVVGRSRGQEEGEEEAGGEGFQEKVV